MVSAKTKFWAPALKRARWGSASSTVWAVQKPTKAAASLEGSIPVQRTLMAVLPVRGTTVWFSMVGRIGPWCGTTSRSKAITRLAPVRFTGSIASRVVERVFDALTLVLLLSVGLLLSGLSTGTTVAGVSVARIATVTAVAGLVVVGLGVLLVARPALLHGLIARVIPEGKLRHRFMSLADGIADGLVVLRSPVRLVALIAWSVGMWLASAASFWLMFRAFDIGVGFAGAMVLQSTMAFGISVPSTPGYIGPFEAIIVAVLNVYGVPDTLAFSYAITYHLTTLVPITLLGLWSLARSGITLRDVRARATDA